MAKYLKSVIMEIQHSSGGVLPSEDTSEARAYKVRHFEQNAAKSEALALTNPDMDSLQKMRCFLKSGSFDYVQETSTEIDDKNNNVEYLLENARLAFFEGRWISSIECVDSALKLSPTSLTQMTLFQVRAAANIEIGHLKQARKDIEKTLTLSSLFPHGDLKFYANAVLIRIEVATGDYSKANQLLQTTWRNIATSEKISVDACLSLLRVEISLLKAQNKPFTHEAIACHLIADRMGEKLYSALGLVELYFSLPIKTRATLDKSIEAAKLNFARANMHANELENQDLPIFESDLDIEKALESNSVLLLSPGIIIDLDLLAVKKVTFTSQGNSLLRLLQNKSISKQNLFSSLWGTSKYSEILHDPVIRSMIYRIRKSCDVAIVTKAGYVELERTIVLKFGESR